MIHPTPADVGRIVLYIEHEGATPQRGRISSMREDEEGTHVWVRYGLSSTGQLTPYERLFWE